MAKSLTLGSRRLRLPDRWLGRLQTALHGDEAALHAPLLDNNDMLGLRQAAARLARWPSRGGARPLAGHQLSVFTGRGLDFEELRAYQQGDEVRAIDWRATARTTRPYIKVYREERDPGLHLVVDRSASMRFGTRCRVKVAQAARLALLLGFAEVDRGGCVGASLIDDPPAFFPARFGHSGLRALTEAMIAPCPPLQTAPPDPGATMGRLLTELDVRLPRGTCLMFISDLRCFAPAHRAVLARLAQRHTCHCFHIVDPSEQGLADLGRVTFRDLLGNVRHYVDLSRRSVRDAIARASSQRLEARAALFERAGIPVHRCGTCDDPAERAMRAQQG